MAMVNGSMLSRSTLLGKSGKLGEVGGETRTTPTGDHDDDEEIFHPSTDLMGARFEWIYTMEQAVFAKREEDNEGTFSSCRRYDEPTCRLPVRGEGGCRGRLHQPRLGKDDDDDNHQPLCPVSLGF